MGAEIVGAGLASELVAALHFFDHVLQQLAGGRTIAGYPVGSLLPKELAVVEIGEGRELGIEGDDAEGVGRIGGNKASEHHAQPFALAAASGAGGEAFAELDVG